MPLAIDQMQGTSMDIQQIYSKDMISDAKFSVFKFAVQFYYTILQRTAQKVGLPDMSRHLKAYINEDLRCASWFLKEFTSLPMLTEVLLENFQKIMRLVFVGITEAAMCQLYKQERSQLNQYWDDPSK